AYFPPPTFTPTRPEASEAPEAPPIQVKEPFSTSPPPAKRGEDGRGVPARGRVEVPSAPVPGPAGEETVIEDAPVLELSDDHEPAEEGFLKRVALEGRLAQLEVLTGSRRFTAARDLARALIA